MGEGGPGVAAGNIVSALRAVAGVADAEIAPDGRPGGAGTLRLTLQTGSDEVAVAAAVNRVLREQFGLAVDADRVAVVDESTLRRPRRSAVAPPETRAVWEQQAEGGSTAEGKAMSTEEVADNREIRLPAAVRHRLNIERLQLSASELVVDAEVTLGWQASSYVGRAQAGATPTSIHRAVANATLRAIEDFAGNGARFELEHLEVATMSNERAVLVEISMVTRAGAERFTGVSAVRDDVRAAVVRACLAALNRRLESFLVPA